MEPTREAIEQRRTAGARLKKSGGGPLIALGIILALAAAAAAAYVALCAYASGSGTLWKGVRVLGQDVGGLAPEAAAAKLEAVLPDLSIDLYPYDGALESAPERQEEPEASIPLKDLGVDLDAAALVKSAGDEAKRGSFLTAGWRFLTGGSQSGGTDLPLDAAKTAAAAEAAAQALARPAEDSRYSMSDRAVLVQMARDGRTVSAGDIQAGLEVGLWKEDLSLDVPYTVETAQTLTAQEIHDAVSGVMKNAGYDAASDTIIPEQTGADFDVSAAQRQMDAAQPGETVEIAAQIEYPAVTAQDLQAVLFRDVLGECTTRVSGTAARISNVRLASSAFNGVVLNTGDVFSYNETVGQRTAAKGYQAAPAYVQGETVDEIGGGVCQPSSTLYLACLRANLEITERYAHRYAPSYIDWGMDATVSWGGPDYKFTNNTEYPIKIVTSYANGSLTIRLLGTNVDGSYVKMTAETLSSTPFETVYKDDPSLPPGTEKVQTTPYTGHRVRSYRSVYSADGTLLSREVEAISDYKSRNKVILRGPEAAVSTDPTVPAVTDPSAGAPVTPAPETGTPVTPPAETPPPAETAPPAETVPPAEEAPEVMEPIFVVPILPEEIG